MNATGEIKRQQTLRRNTKAQLEDAELKIATLKVERDALQKEVYRLQNKLRKKK